MLLLRRFRGSNAGASWLRRRSTRALLSAKDTSLDSDPLSAVFEEIANCDTSAYSEKRHLVKGVEPTGAEQRSSSPGSTESAADPKVKLEVAKQKRLQRQLKDATEELSALVNEGQRATAAEAQTRYVPTMAAKTFLSSAELTQEKSPQEFMPLESSKAELDSVPVLRHSGCSAVITLVAAVTKSPLDVDVVLPGAREVTRCVEFTVRYDVPFLQAPASMHVAVRAIGASLSTFAKESVNVGDIVHVLGHLAPLAGSGEEQRSCCVYVLPAGGNITVLLSNLAA